jgi:hypothetical protein
MIALALTVIAAALLLVSRARKRRSRVGAETPITNVYLGESNGPSVRHRFRGSGGNL